MKAVLARRPDMLHVAFARSPFAHARISSIEVEAAQALPEVVSIVTGADLADLAPLPWPGPPFLPGFPSSPIYRVLPLDRTRCVGQPVAAVVAETTALARDALDRLSINFETLPAVVDVDAAITAAAAITGQPVLVDVVIGRD